MKKQKLKGENVVKLMKIATSEVNFGFNNTIYGQTDGIVMGSSVSSNFGQHIYGTHSIQFDYEFVFTNRLHQIYE